MVSLITGTGRRIECDSVLRSLTFQYLYISTPELSIPEVDVIFNDPAETETLTLIEQVELEDGTVEERTKVFRDWTILEVIRRSPWHEGSLWIWLTRPEE